MQTGVDNVILDGFHCFEPLQELGTLFQSLFLRSLDETLRHKSTYGAFTESLIEVTEFGVPFPQWRGITKAKAVYEK